MEVRAPLIIGAHAWSVKNGVRYKALTAGSALVANGGRKQVGEEPVRLRAALHARAHGVAVEEVWWASASWCTRQEPALCPAGSKAAVRAKPQGSR